MASVAWYDAPIVGSRLSVAQSSGHWEGLTVRAIDVVGSLVLLIFLAPLMLIVAALVFVTNPGPVIFGHRRIGRHGQGFKCLKFRSMVVDAEARLEQLLANDAEARLEWDRDHKLRKDPRITAIGSFLRRTSLDELPQLFNVLIGEMSLVGPRPIVEAEVKRYGRYFGYYKQVRPGITGMWQVGGRNNTTYRRRVALDVVYARTSSVGLYCKILLATVPSVLAARGSY